MLKMVDGTGIIGVDMICPLGISTPQPPNYDRVELEGTGMLVLPNSLKAPLERLELGGKTEQVQTSGKNLANANVYEQGYLTSVNAGDKVSLTQMQKSFTTNMEVSSMQGKNVSVSVRTKEKTEKKYVFTDETDTIITGVFDTGNNNYSEFKNITIPKNAKKLFFSVTYDVQENTELQVELGTTVTAYEPYTGGKPSPSPEYQQEIKSVGKWNEETQKYEVGVKVVGNNLFNREKAKDESNWKRIRGYQNYPIYVGTGNKVTFSYLEKLNTGLPLYFGVGFKESSISEYMYHATTSSLIANKKTLTATGDYAYLIVSESNVPAFLDAIQTFQVEISPTQTNYEPYKEQSLALTSDRPITKWDKLVEQDGQIGWLYGAKRYVVTGSELWMFAGAQYYSGISTSMYANALTNVEQAAVCERLKYEGVIWSKDDKQGFCLNSTNQLHIRFFNEILGVADEATKEEKQKAYVTYLKSEYEKGTPYEIVYKSTATEFVPLPQSEQNAIRALKTYYPTTVITADGGELDPDIKVTYRKEI